MKFVSLSAAIALAACAANPPAPTSAPAPTPTPTRGTPIRLRPGDRVPLTFEAPARPVHGFVLTETTDIVLTWPDGDLTALSPDKVVEGCDDSPCLLALAAPGEHRLEVGGDAPTSAIDVEVRALARPAPVALAPGRPLMVVPTTAAAGDPRGAFADLSITVATSSELSLEVRPRDARPGEALDALLARVGFALVGPGGPVMTITGLSDAGDRLEVSAQVTPATYVLRVRGEAAEVTLVDATPTHVRPDDRARSATPGLPTLSPGGRLAVTVTPAPSPPVIWLELDGHGDLALEWTGQVTPTLEAEGFGRACFDSPCIEERIGPGRYDVSALPRDTRIPVTATATLLAPPPVTATLTAGTPLEVTTRPVAPGDPRAAMAELAFEATSPGSYQLTARVLDGWHVDRTRPDWLDHLPELARLEVVDAATGDTVVGPNLLTSVDALAQGVAVKIVDIEAPGRYLVRLDGDARGARATPRRYQVVVTREP